MTLCSRGLTKRQLNLRGWILAESVPVQRTAPRRLHMIHRLWRESVPSLVQHDVGELTLHRVPQVNTEL